MGDFMSVNFKTDFNGDDDRHIEAAQLRLNQSAVALSEFFDSVQIVATKVESGDMATNIFHAGAGNYFARLGSVHAFLRKEERRMS